MLRLLGITLLCLSMGAILYFLWQHWLKETQSDALERPVYSFSLPSLHNPSVFINQDIFKDKICLVHVWATWSANAKRDHALLMKLGKGLNIIGVNYQDDKAKAKKYLAAAGDPYRQVIEDEQARLKKIFGISGVPETFVVDHNKVIRFRHVGPLTEALWQKKIAPLIQKLRKAHHE